MNCSSVPRGRAAPGGRGLLRQNLRRCALRERGSSLDYEHDYDDDYELRLRARIQNPGFGSFVPPVHRYATRRAGRTLVAPGASPGCAGPGGNGSDPQRGSNMIRVRRWGMPGPEAPKTLNFGILSFASRSGSTFDPPRGSLPSIGRPLDLPGFHPGLPTLDRLRRSASNIGHRE